MLFLRKLVLINKYYILFFTIFFISCGGNKYTGINIVYIFDISGSYYQESLRPSVKLADAIFTDITSTPAPSFDKSINQADDDLPF